MKKISDLVMFKGEEEHSILTVIDDDGQVWYAADDVNEILGIDSEQFDDVVNYKDVDYIEGVLAMNFSGVYDLCLHNKANECEELLEVLNRVENYNAMTNIGFREGMV